MSFFFNKSETEQNLQYDDTAFLHFAISFSAIITSVFLWLVWRDIMSFRRPAWSKISKLALFREKMKQHRKEQNDYFTSWPFIIKITIIFFCCSICYECYQNIETNDQLIGFDPYEILGVEYDAPIIKVKKAYRQLALKYHPDRNQNNPEAAAKFIQVSKAYECLTDPEAKEKCEKYGNPDGQTSFQVGIGLPSVMINRDTQYIVLPAILLIFLVVVPRLFLAWNSKIRVKDESGMEISNYLLIWNLFHPKMNSLSLCLAMGCMRQIDNLLPGKATEIEKEAAIGLLVQSGTLTEEEAKKISPQHLSRFLSFYKYLANQESDPVIANVFPDLAIKLTKFSAFFGKRIYEGKAIYQNPQWVPRWCGLLPLRSVIDFTRQMYNQSIRIGDVSSIQFLDLTEEQMKIARAHPISNLQTKLLNSKSEVDRLVNYFPPESQEYIRQQIDCLPALSLEVRCLLGDEATSEVTTEDYVTFEIKVKKNNNSPGYVATKTHHHLDKEYFFILFSYAANIVHLEGFSFEEGKSEYKCKFPSKFIEPKDMEFQVRVLSNCYVSNMDLSEVLKISVVEAGKETRVTFHPEDVEVEKQSKDFFEQLLSMDMQNESDRELSDGEDDDEDENEEKSKWIEQEARHEEDQHDDEHDD